MWEILTVSNLHTDTVWHGVWHVFLRFMIVCVGALLVVRLMGSRTVGQLSPFDLIIMIGIGDIIIAGAMDQRPTVAHCLLVLFVLLILQQLMGYASLKSAFFRKVFEGLPIVLIEKGKPVDENLVRTQLNYDDLRQELHKQGMDMTDIKDIEIARLESCGYFSVIMQKDANPLTKRDFDDYLKNIYDNPLSFGGEKWTKIEKLMNDVEYLANYLKEHSKPPPALPDNTFDPNIIADNYIDPKQNEIHIH
jgi:uncharacterized membrane protein YcaP (DUF421 family)